MPSVLQIQVLLVTSESKFTDAKKQYDIMLENKQLELSKHLKEISQRNDRVIPFSQPNKGC